MKKIFSGLFVLALLFACSFSALADTAADSGTITVSLENIEQVWTDNSPELTKIDNDLKVAENTYNDLARTATNMSAGLSAPGVIAQYSTVINSRDQAKCAYDISKAQYDQNIQNSLLAVKKAFFACWQDELNIKLTRQNLEIKQAQLKNYADALKNGFISKDTYDNLSNAVDSLKNTLSGLNTKLESDRTALSTKLGLDPEISFILSYPDLNSDTFKNLIVMDFDSDMKNLKDSSVAIKALQITYNSMINSNYANSSQKQRASANLENAKSSLEPNFTTLYNSINSQYDDLKTAYSNLALEKDKLDKIQQQYDQGYVSSLTLSNIKLEYSNMQATVKGKEINLYISYLTYKNTAAGY